MATIDEYVHELDPTLSEVATVLADSLTAGLPGAEGVVWHGHPVWMDGKTPVAGFKAAATWVTLLLWQGRRIDDPSGRLAATGSAQMASARFASVDDVDPAQLRGWLAQAAALDTEEGGVS